MRVPKRVSFIPDDVEIIEISSIKLLAKGLANYHAKAYKFSHFVADAKPIALLTHGNEVIILWHERFGHLNFKYLQQIQNNSRVEGLLVIKATTKICKVVLLASTLSISLIGGRQAEHHESWD